MTSPPEFQCGFPAGCRLVFWQAKIPVNSHKVRSTAIKALCRSSKQSYGRRENHSATWVVTSPKNILKSFPRSSSSLQRIFMFLTGSVIPTLWSIFSIFAIFTITSVSVCLRYQIRKFLIPVWSGNNHFTSWGSDNLPCEDFYSFYAIKCNFVLTGKRTGLD